MVALAGHGHDEALPAMGVIIARVVGQLQAQLRALRDRRMVGPLMYAFEPCWFKQTLIPASLHKLAGSTVV